MTAISQLKIDSRGCHKLSSVEGLITGVLVAGLSTPPGWWGPGHQGKHLVCIKVSAARDHRSIYQHYNLNTSYTLHKQRSPFGGRGVQKTGTEFYSNDILQKEFGKGVHESQKVFFSGNFSQADSKNFVQINIPAVLLFVVLMPSLVFQELYCYQHTCTWTMFSSSRFRKLSKTKLSLGRKPVDKGNLMKMLVWGQN